MHYDAWVGMRPMTPDGLPAIGRVPGLDNVFLATGHAMLGITLAPATGEAIADLICGQPPTVDLAPFDPARFAR
jgi:D-amino-acid dehydrogenase